MKNDSNIETNSAIYTVIALSVLLVVTTFFVVSYAATISIKQIPISHYDTAIPTWAVAFICIAVAASTAACIKNFFGISLVASIFLFLFLNAPLYVLLDNLKSIIDEHTAFSGTTHIETRKLQIVRVDVSYGRRVAYYNGYVSNDGYIAKIFLRQPLYQYVVDHNVHPCINFTVQTKGKNERILFSHNVFNQSDVVSC
jgi:hypothetical protein